MHHLRAARARLRRDRPHQRGLADSRISDHEREPTSPALRLRERSTKRGERLGATKEIFGHRSALRARDFLDRARATRGVKRSPCKRRLISISKVHAKRRWRFTRLADWERSKS